MEKEQAHTGTQRGKAARSLSVLLVEDTPANRRIICHVLEERGHRVTVAETGRQAVEAFQRAPFDAILMDVELPVMDGYQAAAAIRQLERVRAKPRASILGLTAYAVNRVRFASAGMDAFIGKPIDVARLITLLERTVENNLGDRDNEPISLDGGNGISRDSVIDGERGGVNLAATMRRLGGDAELLDKFIDVFNENSLELVEAMRAAAADNDLKTLRRCAHALRGLASNFDALLLMEIAARLERSRLETPVEADSLSEIADEVARVRRALSIYRQTSVA